MRLSPARAGRHRVVAFTALTAVLAALPARVHAQTLDPLNLHLNQTVFAVAVQPDGKIIVGGAFTAAGTGCGATPCPTVRRSLARFNPDGSLDVGFNPGANGAVEAIAVLPNGKTLVAGGFATIGGGGTGAVARPYLARLNGDGGVDEAFDAGVNGAVAALVLQPDGRILIGGSFTSLGVGAGTLSRNGIGRLLADGTVDPTFNPGANGAVKAIAIQADGRILVGGVFTMLGGGGSGTTPRTGLGRLEPTGALDTFNPTLSRLYPPPHVYAIVVQADGQIVVGGVFDVAGGAVRQSLVRLSAAGVTDPTFDAGLTTTEFQELTTVSNLDLQTDGKIMVGGYFDAMTNIGRPALGRVNPNGSLDEGFSTPALEGPGADLTTALALDGGGRVMVGGWFSLLSGAPRERFARFTNTSPALQTVNVSADGSVVTWARSGSSREVDFVTFESTTDSVTWTMLGQGTRTPGGWELTGQTLSTAVAVRARGFVGGSILEGMYLVPGANLLRNPGFDNGTAGWLQFATPDPSYIVSSVNNGVFEFYRVAPPPGTLNQAVVFQETDLQMPAGTTVITQFDLGNSDSARKRLSVLIHDREFRDLAVCTVWLEPNAPLRRYSIATHTTQAMAHATVSFYAASVGSSGGAYRLDNVSLHYVPGAPEDRTLCADPNAPQPPDFARKRSRLVNDLDGPDLIVNGNFASGGLAPGWSAFGQIQAQVTNGVAQFVRPAGAPAGVLFQATGQSVAAGEVLTATFELGNSTEIRRRVLIVLHDLDFSDLSACTFWLEPAQALGGYTMRMFTTRPWTNATFSIYSASVGPEQWNRMDNVTLRTTPDAVIVGTECLEPGAGALTAGPTTAGRSVTAGRAIAPSLSATSAIELTAGVGPTLMWRSEWPAFAYRVDVQVRVAGGEWTTIHTVTKLEERRSLAIDLSPYPGEVVWIRLVFYRDD